MESGIALTEGQIWAVGVVASILVWLFGLLASRVDVTVGRWIKTIVLVACVIGLVYAFYPLQVVPWPDVWPEGEQAQVFLAWAWATVTDNLSLVGAAVMVYNLLINFIVDPERRRAVVDRMMAFLNSQVKVQSPVVVASVPPRSVPAQRALDAAQKVQAGSNPTQPTQVKRYRADGRMVEKRSGTDWVSYRKCRTPQEAISTAAQLNK